MESGLSQRWDDTTFTGECRIFDRAGPGWFLFALNEETNRNLGISASLASEPDDLGSFADFLQRKVEMDPERPGLYDREILFASEPGKASSGLTLGYFKELYENP